MQHVVLINRFLIVEALEGESTRRCFQKGEGPRLEHCEKFAKIRCQVQVRVLVINCVVVITLM